MILITRPINEAKILAKELKTFSLPFLIEPLTSFQYYQKKIILHDKTFFIVSSLQTVHAMKTNQRNYKNIISQGKFLVVGMKVASELKLLGVNNIIKQFKSSDSLFKYLLKKKKYIEFKVEYLCGSIINDEFISGLRKAKIKCKKIVLYKTIAVKKISTQCLTQLKKSQIKIVLIYSAYTAKLFLKLIKQHKLTGILKHTCILCLSERIANSFKDKMPQQNIHWSHNPNQKSLLSFLRSINKKL